MNKFIVLITLFAYIATQAQEKFRISEKQTKELSKISPEITTNILIVEKMLNSEYEPYISMIRSSYKSYRLTEKQIKKIEEIVCIPCYESEWDLIVEKKKIVAQKEQDRKDSIALVDAEKFRKERKEKELLRKEKEKEHEVEKVEAENPYDNLKRSLLGFDRYNRSLTVFRKMDYNFAGGNIQWYMQNDFKMAFSNDYTLTKNKIVENYIAKVSSKDERIRITYNVKYHTDIIGYYESDEVFIIDSVEITGTNNKVVELFLNYWPGKITIEGYKEGVIATKQLMGDYISLIGQGGKYKITITKGNMDVNYQETFGINAKKRPVH